MPLNLSNQLGRLTADQRATITFEAGFDTSLAYSTASYVDFVVRSTNAANPGGPAVTPEIDTIQTALQTGGTVTVGFFNQVPALAFSPAEQNMVLQALAIWSGIADIQFRVVPANQAAIRFVHAGDTMSVNGTLTPIAAGTYFSATATTPTATPALFRTTAGYVALDRATTDKSGNLAYGDFTSLTNLAGYGFDVLVHEVGHLLGLGHTGPYNFNTNPALNVPANSNQNNQSDVRIWSIMSYIDPASVTNYSTSYIPTVTWGADPVASFPRTPLTPMGLDLIAAQRLLGPSGSPLFGGHDIFGFNSNITYTDINGNTAKLVAYDFSLDPNPILTLYDYGLANTLDLSQFTTASTIDLRDGGWSSVAGLTNNIFIEWGTHIDTAIGGSDNDSFVLNADGDTIDGGAGVDVVTLPDRRADYAYSTAGAQIVLTDTRPGHVATNRLSNVESIVFSDATIAPGALSSISWTGGATGDFGIAANWNPAQVPSDFMDVTIARPGGASVQVVQQSTNSFDSLFLGAGNTLDITVGQFGFAGTTRASAIDGTFIVDSGAIAYFNGNLANAGDIQLAGNLLADGPTIAVGGGGTIALQNGVIAAYEDANGAPLAYDAFVNTDNLIRGFGVIGSSGLTFPIRFQNQGTVLADQPLPLVVKGAVTNTGTLAQTGIGTLDLTGDISGGGLITADGTLGSLLLDGAALHASRLTATGGGAIHATGAATLDSTAGAVTIDTTLVVDPGAGLTILGRPTGSGSISAAGAALFLSGPHVLGVPVTGNPTIHFIGAGPTLLAVSPPGTIDPNRTITAGHSLTFAASLQGDAFAEDTTLTLAGTPTSGATMFVDSLAAFFGGGTIALTGQDDAIAGVEANGAPDWLVLSDGTITGIGDVGANTLAIDISGTGTILASGGTMVLNTATIGGQSNLGGAINRAGLVGALPGATLAVMGMLDNQQGGRLTSTGTIAVGGNYEGLVRAGTIRGGTLPAGGRIEGSAAGGTLAGFTNAGLIAVQPDQTLTLSQTATNNATIALTGSLDTGLAIDHPARLRVDSSVSLTGGGAVVLAGDHAQLTGTGTLENVNNAITGQGTLGGGSLQFVNGFTGIVDGTGTGLLIDGTSGGEFNYGTFEATAGGTLVLHGTIANGTDLLGSPIFIGGGGTIIASGAGADVRIDNAIVRNGYLLSDTGGVFDITGSSTLASDNQFFPGFDAPSYSLKNAAHLRVATGATLTATLGLGNAGSIDLLSGATLMATGGIAALAGHGTITLADGALLAAAPGSTLANDDNLIIGSGQIGGGAQGISNPGGTIIASGGTLTIDVGAGARFNSTGGTLGTQGGAVLNLVTGLTNYGYINAGPGSIDIGGTLDGTGYTTLSAGGTVTLRGKVSFAQNFTFTAAGATLDLAAPSQMAGSLGGLLAGDTIRFRGVPGDSASFSSSTLSLNNAGTQVASVALFGNYVGRTFDVTSDGAGGSLVTLACFAEGTRIATPDGEVPVEALLPGDRVLSAFGGAVPVAWLGHRRLDLARHPRPWDVMPVRIMPNAFGPGRPHRDLWLSPDHAIHLGGALIPVRYLVNGATIRQETARRVTYWHVELPAHDILLAEGLACESYLDTGNRAAFANGGPIVTAHPDFARTVWDACGCAPLLVEGPGLADARTDLLAQATHLGHRVTADPGLVLTLDGRPHAVTRHGDEYSATLPPGASHLRLRSRSWVPAHMRPHETDTRRLGVAIANLRLGDRPVPLDDRRLGAGWHAPEPAWRWTTGDADLAVTGAGRLSFTLALAADYWLDTPPPSRAIA